MQPSLNGLDLFSGIGGLTIALGEWSKPIAYCEIDPYCQAVLLSRMQDDQLPRAPIWDDVRLLSGMELRGHVDIIYGGFPCQDISAAGPRIGIRGKRSGLFYEIVRLVGEVRPVFVFLENVPAITIRGLEQVCLEFTKMGYDCRWTIVSAAEVGAPHLRERWFFLAHSMRQGLQESGYDETTACEGGTKPWRTTFGGVQTSDWNATASGVHRMDDGIRPKTHRTKALGNSVVPIQAREAFMRLSGLKRPVKGSCE